MNYDEYGFGTGQGLQLRKLNQPFSWHENSEDGEDGDGAADEDGGGGEKSNKTVPVTCRNSVQGKILITDDRGMYCYWQARN